MFYASLTLQAILVQKHTPVYVGTQFVTIPVSILDAVFLPVSKLERFRSKIVTDHFFVCW